MKQSYLLGERITLEDLCFCFCSRKLKEFLKNLQLLDGKPQLWSFKWDNPSEVEQVFVSTEDQEIAEVAVSLVRVILRQKSLQEMIVLSGWLGSMP